MVKWFISKGDVERSVGESRFDSMSKEGSEEDIVEGNEEVSSDPNFEWNKEDYN